MTGNIKLLIGLLVFNLHTTAFANKKVYDQQIVNAYNPQKFICQEQRRLNSSILSAYLWNIYKQVI